MLYQKESLNVRHLQDEDKQFLAKWLSNPAVLEFYEGRDNPFDAEKVANVFFNGEAEVEKCIVEYNQIRIGYIQFYQVNEETSKIRDYGTEENIYGMDQFIGETEYWNKGIGTLLVNSMVEYLVEKKQANRIIMDPQISNARALRCYEKCGFKKVRILPKHEFHEGQYRDCWLIEYKISANVVDLIN
ncbi:GNAT family N-acetyltransferase [Neobacillus mesonae]|uniref:GNAT family N-acetyltransferase n=1 Tax=Neobacillus mesonae TaxID=1193713 RepID=A0A3T0HUU4_9BACI|nr:GNAT family N-acetyltransferase [Neobacillus mesonae]AZU60758.1 GNAT family N-acetyltransferase [Neobacillus mesonae]